ncbi:alcohol dehydrogenase GroES-like domain-containing protein, partial [Westerdykella ornata]
MTTTTPQQPLETRASVLHGAKDLRISTRLLPPPSPTELQIAIHTTGLCGSDLHYYRHFRNGDILVREPLTLGHESAGIVVGIGSSVSNDGWKIGDKVALEVGQPCETCDRCREGRYNICPQMRFRSSAKAWPHAQGTLQEVVNHPARWCHKLPPTLTPTHGALLEPLSVAIHACRRASLAPGSAILVFGAGTVGLLVAAMAKMLSKASTVVIADIDAGRVDFALRNRFADRGFTVPPRRRTGEKGEDIDDHLAAAKELAAKMGSEIQRTDGTALGEVDAVFECTGVPSCLQTAIYATRPGGRVMLIGMGTPVQTLPISAAALREVDLVGVFRYADTYPEGIEVMSRRAEGDPDFDSLITHRFKGLDAVEQAFEMAARTVDDNGNLVIKVVVETS